MVYRNVYKLMQNSMLWFTLPKTMQENPFQTRNQSVEPPHLLLFSSCAHFKFSIAFQKHLSFASFENSFRHNTEHRYHYRLPPKQYAGGIQLKLLCPTFNHKPWKICHIKSHLLCHSQYACVLCFFFIFVIPMITNFDSKKPT